MIENDYIDYNPCRKVKKYTEDNERSVILPEEVQEGQMGVASVTATQATGNGDGDLCPAPEETNGITVFIPCRRK